MITCCATKKFTICFSLLSNNFIVDFHYDIYHDIFVSINYIIYFIGIYILDLKVLFNSVMMIVYFHYSKDSTRDKIYVSNAQCMWQ